MMDRQKVLENIVRSRAVRAIRSVHVSWNVQRLRERVRQVCKEAELDFFMYGQAFIKIDLKGEDQ